MTATEAVSSTNKLVVAAERRMDPWASAAQITAAQQPNNVVRAIMKSLELKP